MDICIALSEVLNWDERLILELYPYPWEKLIVHLRDWYLASMVYSGGIKRYNVLK